jgi:hypothetical protein
VVKRKELSQLPRITHNAQQGDGSIVKGLQNKPAQLVVLVHSQVLCLNLVCVSNGSTLIKSSLTVLILTRFFYFSKGGDDLATWTRTPLPVAGGQRPDRSGRSLRARCLAPGRPGGHDLRAIGLCPDASPVFSHRSVSFKIRPDKSGCLVLASPPERIQTPRRPDRPQSGEENLRPLAQPGRTAVSVLD